MPTDESAGIVVVTDVCQRPGFLITTVWLRKPLSASGSCKKHHNFHLQNRTSEEYSSSVSWCLPVTLQADAFLSSGRLFPDGYRSIPGHAAGYDQGNVAAHENALGGPAGGSACLLTASSARFPLLIQQVKTVFQIVIELPGGAEPLRRGKAHIVGFERIGDDQMRLYRTILTGDPRPEPRSSP